RVKEQLSDSPIVREAARIKILNGSGVSGVARDAQVALEEEGYNIVEIGDAPEGEYSDITIYSLDERVTNTVQALKKYYGVQFEEYDLPDNIESEGIDIVIIIGTETKTEE
ncbi:MAG: LytR C-terminal domain-containing protein, partial [Candidatus Saccharibacteria bacterium]|nr:LytR C-terminal domain-containing protein [Candidatus Saccharibacteria bacterium]